MKKLLLIIGGIAIILFSCKKETKPSTIGSKPLFEESNCVPDSFPKRDPYQQWLGWTFVYKNESIERMAFNPNNQDELVMYVRGSGGVGSIIKYNMATKVRQTLVTHNTYYGPRMGKNNKIYYTDVDANVYEIDENGNNKRQLTFGGTSYAIALNSDATKIMVNNVRYIPATNSSFDNSIIYDINGNSIDSTSYIINSSSDWSGQNQICSPGMPLLNILDLNTKSEQSYLAGINDQAIPSSAWSKDGNRVIYRISVGDIYSYNIRTSENKHIAKFCAKTGANNIAIQPNTGKIFFVKFKQRYLYQNFVECTIYLCSINEDGTGYTEMEW